MKQLIRFAVCMALIFALLAANICVTSAADTFLKKVEMLEMMTHIEDDAGMGAYGVVQGACTDGKYAYFAAMQGGATILKYDVNSWELVASERISNVGHGNDMAYNSDENVLVIANNAPYYNIVTLVDPDTLKVIKDVELKKTVKEKTKNKETGKEEEKEVEKELDIYAIAYNAKLKQYVVGISGGYDFALLDKDFKLVKTFEGEKTGYTRQGCDCDENYIYFPQSGGNNILVIYDYTGKHIATIPMSNPNEVENIFHVGNTFYTSMYYYGNTLHRIGFSDKTRIAYTVTYDPNGGEGEMEPTRVIYGEPTALRENTFTREGYLFAGWRVQRDSDGKVAGYRNGEDDYGWISEDEVFDYHLYADKDTVSTTVKNGGVKLSASWIAERYEIRFDSDGGEGYTEPFTVAYDENAILPESGFTREGYIFDGYTASRDVDGRVFGCREGSDKVEWLYPEDAAQLYIYHPGDMVRCMTYDGGVTFTARFKFAYTFGDDGSTLVEYVGVDEKVNIPSNDGELTTLAEGAIKDNELMTELHIPASVNEMQRGAVSNCPKLRSIYFEDALPEKLDDASVEADEAPAVYLSRGGYDFCIGFYADAQSAPLIRCHAAALERDFQERIFDR